MSNRVDKEFSFESKVWLYPGKAGWHFVTVPEDLTKELDFWFSDKKRGFGSLPVTVTVGETNWETSIFPDKKTSTFVLPLKAAVRKEENISLNQTINLSIEIRG